MAFLEYNVKHAWKRAGGSSPPNPSHCECTYITHDHGQTRCNKQLIWANRGRDGNGGWEAHSFSGSYLNVPYDCAVFCWKCHKAGS